MKELNCGPHALAFVLGLLPDKAAELLPGFHERGWTNPTMVREALAASGHHHYRIKLGKPGLWQEPRYGELFAPHVNKAYRTRRVSRIVRIQWDGPWCDPGVPARAAYCHTHWMATETINEEQMVFDVNCNLQPLTEWLKTVREIMDTIPRCSGQWWPTHVWQVWGKHEAV